MYSHVLGSMRYMDTECGDALFSTHLQKIFILRTFHIPIHIHVHVSICICGHKYS